MSEVPLQGLTEQKPKVDSDQPSKKVDSAQAYILRVWVYRVVLRV